MHIHTAHLIREFVAPTGHSTQHAGRLAELGLARSCARSSGPRRLERPAAATATASLGLRLRLPVASDGGRPAGVPADDAAHA